jgi:hypothetical protein
VLDPACLKRTLREITRVNFGGDYENAPQLVGGEPPVDSASD